MKLKFIFPECVKFPEEDVYGHFMMIPMLISVMGLFFTAIVVQTFVMHNQHPVVKVTSYLSAIMLGCMILVHSIVILLSLKICLFTCGVFKYLIPLCFTAMYSAMLVKINRMYRAWEIPPSAEVVSLPSITSKKSAVMFILFNSIRLEFQTTHRRVYTWFSGYIDECPDSIRKRNDIPFLGFKQRKNFPR